MYFEIFVIGAIVLYIMIANGYVSTRRFISDNEIYFKKLKEDDWDFYCKAKYGDSVNPNILFNKRIRNGVIVAGVLLFFFITDLNYIKIIFAVLAGVVVFKMDYTNMKNYYKNEK